MPYTPQTWADGAAGGTPLSAARLGYIESGIEAAALDADTDGVEGLTYAWTPAQLVDDVRLDEDLGVLRHDLAPRSWCVVAPLLLNMSLPYRSHFGAASAPSGEELSPCRT